MQMAPHAKEQDGQPIEQITKRYVPIDGGVISLWNLPVILSMHGPTAGPVDNLRSDRARAQQGNHIGKRFHVPDDL
jgi:hypothetical protein